MMHAAAANGRQHGSASKPAPPVTRLLLHASEITLKGRNRGMFERRLRENVVRRLQGEGLAWPVTPAYGRLYVDTEGRADAEVRRAVAALRQVAGIDSVAAAHWLRPPRTGQHGRELDWPMLEEPAVALAAATYLRDARFAVRVNRTDKRVPATSQQIETRLGAVIREGTPWDRVDLRHPERTYHVDIYPDGMYLYADKMPGLGGLPTGTGGRALALLSGGIDSPVAAYLLAKRGCRIDFVHMSATFLSPSQLEQSVVGRLAAHLSRYTLRSRLYVMPYTHFDLALPGRHSGLELVLFRRFLLRTAEALAERVGAQALISGDSLGQVASQTMENLVSASMTKMPVLRPLIGFNKQEIITLARRIETFELSIQPHKDCCALLAGSPLTSPARERVERAEAEALPQLDELVSRTLEECFALQFECGRLLDVEPRAIPPAAQA